MAHPVRKYSSVDEALAACKAWTRWRSQSEVVPVRKAFGRVSAEDVVAPEDVPAFATSHWDGYAVIAADLEGANDSNPASLNLVGAVGPGARPGRSIAHGETLHVATGAPLPAGADSVVPVESADVEGRRVLVKFAPKAGSHVYGGGEEARRGETVLEKGRSIRAQDITMLLAFGHPKVKVWMKPKVSVIATGSELTNWVRPKPGKVTNSHSALFLRLCEELGCVPVDLGIAKDEPRVVVSLIRKALATSDFVLTLGGTSAGRHDVVEDALSALRPEIMVHGIAMDRGRVTGIAVVKGKPILMMPGPIQGAMTAFVLLGLPTVRLLSGRKDRGFELTCRLGRGWEARTAYAHFRKVVYVKLGGGEELVAEPLSGETESVKILSDADGYIVVPEGVKRVEEGTLVKVSLVPGFSSIW